MLFSLEFRASSGRRFRFPAASSVGLSMSSACLKMSTAIRCRPNLLTAASRPADTSRPSTCSRYGAHLSGQEPGHFPLTESIARRTLALPFFNRITADQQQEVTEALRGAISCSDRMSRFGH